MTAIALIPGKNIAYDVLNAMAGELGAHYDAMTARWTYKRYDGEERQLWLDQQEKGWALCISNGSGGDTDADSR